MNTRERAIVKQFRQMVRARVKHPSIIAKLPIVGLAEVWAMDGDAYIFPGFGGVIVRDWFESMRFISRRQR